MKGLKWGFFCFLFFFSQHGYAQTFDKGSTSNEHSLFPQRTEYVDIEVDGLLDESVWSNMTPVTEWYQQSPNEGEKPSERTVMWMAYDDEALYLAAKVFEKNPSEVTSKNLERDTYTREEDAIGLILDTSNDERTAYGFIVTPAGVRTDIAIANNAISGWNQNWNTFWTAETSQTEYGWNVEARIPFSSLRFESSSSQPVTMGMILWRYMARNVEYDVFPAIPNNWGSNSAFKPSEARTVTFKNIASDNPLYIKPYALAGLQQENVIREDGSGYKRKQEFRGDIGLDIKYNLSSSLILDITANTDFAQVEADDEQINLSRFSLFRPEKRDFFQERADLFEFRFPGGPQRIFQSRKIGLYNGELVPIIGGARLTGSTNSWDLGILNMQTAETAIGNEWIPSENFGILRLQRTVFNEASYIGGMATSRTDFDGNYNFVYAADADINVWRDDYIGIQFAQSVEPEVDLGESNIATLLFQRRIQRGFSVGTSFKHVGKTFNPAVGFLQRQDIKRWGTRTRYTWYPEKSELVQSYKLTHRFQFIWDAQFSKLETGSSSLAADVSFLSSATGQIQVEYTHENLQEAFSIGSLKIPEGLYKFWDVGLKASSPAAKPFKIEVGLDGGRYFGGTQLGGSFSPIWVTGPHLSLSLDYLYSRVNIEDGKFDTHITRFRVASALNKKLSASSYIQYNSGESLLTPNVRIRYNPKEGSDLFIVYNEGINIDSSPENKLDPRLPRMQARSILLKYTYTFTL